ncbi:MAG: ABC transporter substrate-binding protein [Sulfurospirillaceae bacterium]|nr:ABC transporter substrate-binding protein [Sulfurospirillaceae bacterium]
MKIIFLCLLIVVNIFALSENQIQSFMKTNINEAVKLIKESKQTKENKDVLSKKIFKLFDPVFDYKLMARLSIGGETWRELSQKQKEEFTQKFTKRLKESYKSKLDKYDNQEIIVKGVDKIKENRIHLLTQIEGKKEKYDIVYKFYKTRDNQWYIYDVDVLGVSVIQTYRSQFSDELKKYSFNELLAKLNDTNN